MARCSKAELEYIINHVVLPPKLPHQPEGEEFVGKAGKALLNELLSALERFLQQCAPEFKASWCIVQKMLIRYHTAKLWGDVSETGLTQTMLSLETGDAFPIRIRAQNAAIILRRTESVTILECFELSPQSSNVISCKGSLRRVFPAQAVAIPREVAIDPSFCREFSTMLRRLDSEVVDEMMPKSRKANQDFAEFRDTCHPGLVSELLMASMAALGAPSEILQIQKRIRDDVVWGHSKLPWRRSTLWLLLRIAIHTTLIRGMEPEHAHVQFKNFILYFLTHVLNLTTVLPSALDISKTIEMKIAQRAIKLGATILPFVEEAALMQTEKSAERQMKVWQVVQEQDAKRQTDIDVTTLEMDTKLTLVNSRTALDAALRDRDHDPQWAVSIPTDYYDWILFHSDGLPFLNEAIHSRPERLFALSAYQQWIDESLITWLDGVLLHPTPAACTSLHRSAECYNRLALDLYSTERSSQHLSTMLLTLGDLWCALDKIAGSLMPLLHAYPPEVPAGAFDVLLLPQVGQMQRLRRLQLYIEERRRNAQYRNSSLFADHSPNDRDSFASRYFDKSIDHQELRQQILAHAEILKAEKQQEWHQKTAQHKALITHMNRLSCTSTEADYYGNLIHDSDCNKCRLKSEAEALSIAVFEWPLPENETQSRLAVLYLRIPEVYAAWQNFTWMLCNDLGREENVGGSDTAGRLSTYGGLARYFENGENRLILASTTKSVSGSHYRESHFPIPQKKVFSAHALYYKLYDRDCGCWVGDQTTRPSFDSMCQTILSEEPYKNLQYTVDSTSHAQNAVLAAQTDCSPDLSIHEHISFGSLRADGEKTQWLNICREMRASTLSWNTESVCTLIKQSAWQACSIGTTTLGTAHEHFKSIEFTTGLLSNLESMLNSIQANRQCHYVMEILVILALRTLSMTMECKEVTDRCLEVLQRCRSVIFAWVEESELTLRLATDSVDVANARRNLLILGMLCKLTFAVDTCYYSQALATPQDLLQWTSASMIVENNTPATEAELPRSVRLALLNDVQLSQRYHKHVYRMLSTTANFGLDGAVRRVWSSFHSAETVWTRLVHDDTRRLYKHTVAGLHTASQKVSYNVLSGELLVDGRPLGLLPKDYTTHRFYIRLFGAQILRISTSDMVGMHFMTAAEEHGYRFYFELRGDDLVIRAKTASTILELIPNEKFVNDFPTIYAEDFAHWLDLNTSVVEFRPLDRRWSTDDSNWRLTYRRDGSSYFWNHEYRLVDVRSRTCQRTMDVLGTLETAMFTHVTRSTTGRLHIHLPRFGLRFFRNDNSELECQELRKIVDRDQSLGTLIGLKTRLVLCARGIQSKKLDRLNTAFFDTARKIVAHSEQFSRFYQGLDKTPALDSRGDEDLLQRAKFRESTLMNVDYRGNEHTVQQDRDYDARDVGCDADKVSRVYTMSSLVKSWTGDMTVTPDLAPTWTSWGVVGGFGYALDCSQPIADLLLLDVAQSWGSLYETCRISTEVNSLYKLLFMFAQISYGSKASLNSLKTLLAFATNESLHNQSGFPNYSSFQLGSGSEVHLPKLRSKIKEGVKPFKLSSNSLPPAQRQQEHADYQTLSSANVETAVGFYSRQWPCSKPPSILEHQVKWLKCSVIKSSIDRLFAEWYKNRECQQHLAKIRGVIQSTMTSPIDFTFTRRSWQQTDLIPSPKFRKTPSSLSCLMDNRTPITRATMAVPLSEQPNKSQKGKSSDLRSLVTRFGANNDHIDNPLRSRYKADLLASIDALQAHSETVWPHAVEPVIAAKVCTSFGEYRSNLETSFDRLCFYLRSDRPCEKMLKAAGLWPRLCVRDLLALIAETSSVKVKKEWRDRIVAMGIEITVLQRARRLILAAEKGDALAFYQELGNAGQCGWSAYERPDWLLMEIQNDFLIRPVQVSVAMEMVEPSSSSNTLMQLNMGEGKSSVIIPLIAAVLADKTLLVRVIVLRSLGRQMQDTLTQRLGGLVNRPVYIMPFSRKTEMHKAAVDQMQSMYADCMANGGVVIAQPEHLLSFKLMGIERVASEDHTLGAELMKTQAWLDDNCRDVLDESDEILDVKFQLIYTLGAQRNMDGQPDRWLMMQGVFDIVQTQALLLQAQHPQQIEVDKRTPGSFPSIRLLSAGIRNSLIADVGKAICDSKVAGLVIPTSPPQIPKAIACFVRSRDVSTADCETIQSHCVDNEAYLKKLLFVRGLIACGILLHVLHDKRWCVTYGLHLTRCLCAVPYRAKGLPAPTAEFGHPDVAIALTCLSYYYTGLTNDQLRTSLEILQKADDPSFEYCSWVAEDPSFPRIIQSWHAVNLEDHRQCNGLLFPALKFNKRVADFFMTNVVFPKEGKEFDQKLSTSGWDIPAKPHSQHITTGFSGTNDNRFLLPSSISQHDLPQLQHTSAKVLAFLLQPENLSYMCAKDAQGCQLSSQGLLECIVREDSKVRVLIDVGAQILDLSNREVIARWLALTPTVDAGVFFNEDDIPMVVTRDGTAEALMTSSFANRMDRCVVYLDDVHTRGTDLKMPLSTRAAVTLGPRLAKDRLVQACMRLRQLGQGQSLMYIAPPEVHLTIVEATSPSSSPSGITGHNVVEWALEQSCLQIERNQPLRAVQGLSYHQRQKALRALKQRLLYPNGEEGTSTDGLGDEIIEHEAQSLHDLYAPDEMRDDDSDLITKSRSSRDQTVQELVQIWDRIDPHTTRNANMHEELEREVGHEVEQETQIQRPPRATPEERKVDPNLVKFIRTGAFTGLFSSGNNFSTVFSGVPAKSSAANVLQAEPWQRLQVTSDFIRTIKVGAKAGVNDDYLRPVTWLLVSKNIMASKMVLIISQFEANECFDLIQTPSSRVTLINYEPRVTRSMPSLECSPIQYPLGAQAAWDALDLDLRQAVHLFAGQLYFTTFEEYEHLVKSLAEKNAAPVGFMREWIGIRRKGQNYLQTHLGQVTSGRVLHREIFEAGDGSTGVVE
ncbi:MAG: hypothetical protein Q9168_005470 [Polycauliona sp. 1 TL-2023]